MLCFGPAHPAAVDSVDALLTSRRVRPAFRDSLLRSMQTCFTLGFGCICQPGIPDCRQRERPIQKLRWKRSAAGYARTPLPADLGAAFHFLKGRVRGSN